MKTYSPKLTRMLGLLSVTSLLAISGSLSAADVTQPGDPITATSGNSPALEGVANAIDNSTNSKYLNFDKLNTGFTVTPSAGSSRVTGLSLSSANDAPERDPASFALYGSRDGGATLALIATGNIPTFSGRYTQQNFAFPNTTIYTTYKLIFPTVANAGAANSMQISEVQFNGDVPVAADTFPPVIATISAPDANHVVIHLSEPVDPSGASASFNDGLNITAPPSLSADSTTITLTTSAQIPGHTYTLTTSGTKDFAAPPNTMAPGTTATFTGFSVPPTLRGVSVSFMGRNAPPGGNVLAANEVAGVEPRSNWNNVDDDAVGNNATTAALRDSTGATSPVTLTYAANDDWESDGPTVSPNERMMFGIIKRQNANTAATFTFNNVPAGTYDLYVYTLVNGDGVRLNLSDGVTTYYTVEQHQFSQRSDQFVRAKNTNPAGPYDYGNYVVFPAVTLNANQVVLSATYISGGDGLGIAGLQLLPPSPPTLVSVQSPDLNTVSLVFNKPVSDDSVSNLGNFSINNGVTVTAATLSADQKRIDLTTSALAPATQYVITVNNVANRSVTHDIMPTATVTFSSQTFGVSVSFMGRNAPSPGANTLAPGDVAGVLRRANWNNVDDDANGNNATTGALNDSTGAATPITLTYAANDDWENDGPTGTPDEKMMFGIIKRQGSGTAATFNFNNVPEGTYDMYVYMNVNGDGVQLNIQNGAKTYYVIEEHSFGDAGSTFFRAQNTNPSGARDYGNYVKFDSLNVNSTDGSQVPLSATYISGGDGLGIAGIQLIKVVNNNPFQFTTQPTDQSVKETKTYTFTASLGGAFYHSVTWFTNGVAVTGNDTLTLSGTAYREMDGMTVSLTADNGTTTITSSTAILHVLVDNTPPTLTEATADPIATHVRLVFSEAVTAVPGNFVFLTGGLHVTGVETLADGKTLLLTTDNPLIANTSYQLQISNVKDLAGIPNTISPNPTIANFSGWVCTNGAVLRQMYMNESGPNNFATMFNDPNFPCNPTTVDFLTNGFNSPQTPFEHYGLRVRGYLLPTENGDYTFRVHSDDSGRLQLSTDSSESNLVTVINAEGDCGGCGSPVSTTPIHLLAGHAYFIQGLMQEGTGGDYLEVSWRNNGSISAYVIIPPANLSYCVNPDSLNVVVTGPPDANVTECRSATFSVSVSSTCGSAAPTVQWQKDGVDISGATAPSYTTPLLAQSDSGSTYHVIVTALGKTVTSRDALLTVSPDVTPPAIVDMRGDATFQNLYITYSEPVDPVTASDGLSYSVTDPMGNPLNISASGTMLSNNTVVVFTTDPQTPGTRYTVAVNPGLLDLCQANTIADPFGGFTAWVLSSCFATWEVYGPINGTLVSDLTSSPLYPHFPRERYTLSTFDSRQAYPDDSHDNYGSRFTATFTAPLTGSYVFYMENDDDAELDLDGINILAKPCCNGTFVDTAASLPIPMVAGETHALVALNKEGGGGDYLRIAVRVPGDTTATANLQPINPSYLSTYINLDDFKKLPVSGMLPLGSLTYRGFDVRQVKINPASGTIPNSTATAEQLLAGTYTDAGGGPYANVASVPCFVEQNIINYSIEASSYGHLPNDASFPGFPTAVDSRTEDMAMEILTYVELTAGLHIMGVNSDDGFRVSPATSVTDANNAITLGEFSGGRGASDTIFLFDAPQSGLYPFRVVWEQGNGGANIEWWEFNCGTGSYFAINGSGGPRAFRQPAKGPVPALTCPGNMTLAADPVICTAVLTYTPPSIAACPPIPVTCTPAPGSSLPIGSTTVVCTADDGLGNTSTCSFVVNVIDTTAPAISCPGDFTVDAPGQGSAIVNYTVTASDCQLISLSCSPPSGSPFPSGTTQVNCQAGDRSGNANSCSFRVTVNNGPVPVLSVSCSYSDGTNVYVIAYEETNACMILNGAGSSDINHDPLDIRWIVDGTNLYAGPLVTNCLSAGCHSVTLLVGDGRVVNVAHTNVCVITASEAVGQCVALVDNSVIQRKNKRPLLDALKQAGAAFDRRKFKEAMDKLEAFEHKATGEVGKQNPDEAVKFIICAQNIISALTCANDLAEVGVGIDDDKLFPDNDKDIPVFMCHDGHTEAVHNADDVAHKLAEGWTLGPCPGSTVMCHDGETVAIDNPNDVAHHLAEPGGHWSLGNCPFPVIMCHDGNEELVQPDDVAHHLAEPDGHWQLGPCPPPAIMCHDGKLQLVDKPSEVAHHLAEGWTLGPCPPGTPTSGSHKP